MNIRLVWIECISLCACFLLILLLFSRCIPPTPRQTVNFSPRMQAMGGMKILVEDEENKIDPYDEWGNAAFLRDNQPEQKFKFGCGFRNERQAVDGTVTDEDQLVDFNGLFYLKEDVNPNVSLLLRSKISYLDIGSGDYEVTGSPLDWTNWRRKTYLEYAASEILPIGIGGICVRFNNGITLGSEFRYGYANYIEGDEEDNSMQKTDFHVGVSIPLSPDVKLGFSTDAIWVKDHVPGYNAEEGHGIALGPQILFDREHVIKMVAGFEYLSGDGEQFESLGVKSGEGERTWTAFGCRGKYFVTGEDSPFHIGWLFRTTANMDKGYDEVGKEIADYRNSQTDMGLGIMFERKEKLKFGVEYEYDALTVKKTQGDNPEKKKHGHIGQLRLGGEVALSPVVKTRLGYIFEDRDAKTGFTVGSEVEAPSKDHVVTAGIGYRNSEGRYQFDFLYRHDFISFDENWKESEHEIDPPVYPRSTSVFWSTESASERKANDNLFLLLFTLFYE